MNAIKAQSQQASGHFQWKSARLKLLALLGLLIAAWTLPTAAHAGPFPKPGDIIKESLTKKTIKANKPAWTNEYDDYFRKYSKRYFGPFFDWKWFKAQAIAESALKPDAVSWVGAKGLMQIMPATYDDIKKRNPHFTDITSERWNIAAGIYYNQYLYRHWAGLPTDERLKFTFASYNCGIGNVLKARKVARAKPSKSPDIWLDVSPHSPTETQGYVKKIMQTRKGL